MEAERALDVPPVRWRPRKAAGVVLARPNVCEPGVLRSKGGEDGCPRASRAPHPSSAFSFYLDPQQMRLCPPVLGRVITLLSMGWGWGPQEEGQR